MTEVTHEPAELRELYRELILDHARHPRHFEKLRGATHAAEGVNPLCGDKLKLYLALDESERITAASFEGRGCAISVASASLLTDSVAGLTKSRALDAAATTIARLTGASVTAEPANDKLLALEGVKEFPVRVKCATLAWHALASALDDSSPVTTE